MLKRLGRNSGINWVPRCAFITESGKEFIITAVWWQAGEKESYEFQDRQGKSYTMAAARFHEKINDDNFVGIK